MTCCMHCEQYSERSPWWFVRGFHPQFLTAVFMLGRRLSPEHIMCCPWPNVVQAHVWQQGVVAEPLGQPGQVRGAGVGSFARSNSSLLSGTMADAREHCVVLLCSKVC